jgi:hypothetical protein
VTLRHPERAGTAPVTGRAGSTSTVSRRVTVRVTVRTAANTQPCPGECARGILRAAAIDRAATQPPEHVMGQATLKNQQKILADNRAIIANQKKIIKNQDRLAPILANQEKIIRNQAAIIRNQKKILSDHARRFREIALRESKARRAS